MMQVSLMNSVVFCLAALGGADAGNNIAGCWSSSPSTKSAKFLKPDEKSAPPKAGASSLGEMEEVSASGRLSQTAVVTPEKSTPLESSSAPKASSLGEMDDKAVGVSPDGSSESHDSKEKVEHNQNIAAGSDASSLGEMDSEEVFPLAASDRLSQTGVVTPEKSTAVANTESVLQDANTVIDGYKHIGEGAYMEDTNSLELSIFALDAKKVLQKCLKIGRSFTCIGDGEKKKYSVLEYEGEWKAYIEFTWYLDENYDSTDLYLRDGDLYKLNEGAAKLMFRRIGKSSAFWVLDHYRSIHADSWNPEKILDAKRGEKAKWCDETGGGVRGSTIFLARNSTNTSEYYNVIGTPGDKNAKLVTYTKVGYHDDRDVYSNDDDDDDYYYLGYSGDFEMVLSPVVGKANLVKNCHGQIYSISYSELSDTWTSAWV